MSSCFLSACGVSLNGDVSSMSTQEKLVLYDALIDSARVCRVEKCVDSEQPQARNDLRSLKCLVLDLSLERKAQRGDCSPNEALGDVSCMPVSTELIKIRDSLRILGCM